MTRYDLLFFSNILLKVLCTCSRLKYTCRRILNSVYRFKVDQGLYIDLSHVLNISKAITCFDHSLAAICLLGRDKLETFFIRHVYTFVVQSILHKTSF